MVIGLFDPVLQHIKKKQYKAYNSLSNANTIRVI